MANMFKHEVDKKIPEEEKTTAYKLLLEIIEKRNLHNKQELETYLQQRTQELQKTLQTHPAAGTASAHQKNVASELELLGRCNTFLRYL